MNERLKAIRTYYGLSMREFALKLGVSHSVISLYESGDRPIVDRVILTLCLAFPDVNEEWFRTGVGEMLRPKDRNSEIADIVAMMFKGDESDFRFQLTKLLYEMDADEIAAFKNIIVKMAATIEKTRRSSRS